MSDLIRDSDDLDEGPIVVFGAPMVGKTVFAATASEQCPAELPNKGERIKLSDMFWVVFDDGALASLKDVGLKVDCIEFADVINKHDAGEDTTRLKTGAAFRAAMSEIFGIIRERKPKFVVWDTMSEMNRKLATFHQERLVTLHGGNTMRMYGQVAAENSLLHQALVRLPTQNIFLFHAQADTSDLIDPTAKGGMEAAQKSQRATKADGDMGKADVILAAVGQARDLYVHNVSYVFNLRSTFDGKKDTRVLHSRQKDGTLAKSRGINRLPAEMQNPTMGKVFALLRGKS